MDRRGTRGRLAVPSVIVASELNYLLNPMHPAFARLVIRDPQPDVCRDCQTDCVLAQALGGGGTAHAPAVLPAGVHGNPLRAIDRAGREDLANALRKSSHELCVELGSAHGLAIPTLRPRLGVTQTLRFSPCERRFLHQESLPLVACARATPFEHDSDQFRMGACAPRACGPELAQASRTARLRFAAPSSVTPAPVTRRARACSRAYQS